MYKFLGSGSSASCRLRMWAASSLAGMAQSSHTYIGMHVCLFERQKKTTTTFMPGAPGGALSEFPKVKQYLVDCGLGFRV